MVKVQRIIRKISIFLLTLILVVTIGSSINYADTFHSYNIDVTVRKDGSADFVAVMDFEATKGTEYYIPIGNLGQSNIVNYRVSEIVNGEEVEYSEISSWNVKASREAKKDKYGIVKKSDGVELCFGIGDYARKTYILRYTVTDFVKILNDSDMIFWKFVNDSLEAGPKTVKVSISKEDGTFENTNSKIWGFGGKGTVNFIDGKIIFESMEKIGSSNYVTILSQVDKGYFNSGEKIDRDFSYYKDMAFEGSQYVKESKNVFKSFIKLLSEIWFVIIFLIIGVVSIGGRKIKGGYKKGDLKGEYYRTVPLEEWWKLSLILDSMNFNGNKAIIRGFFLKWIQEKRLIPITEETGTFFKKDSLSLMISRDLDTEYSCSSERQLFEMVRSAAREDLILQENEFKKYLKKDRNQKRFKKFTDDLDASSKAFLKSMDYLETNKINSIVKKYNEKGKNFTGNLIKYYNYLKDFTLLSEREINEIKVWKDLLVYANLFDVADVVEKQLGKLSPEILQEQGVDVNNMHNAMLYSHVFSNNFINAYTSSVRSSSGGGGGSTSIGGGGGSFGGGSGGGTR